MLQHCQRPQRQWRQYSTLGDDLEYSYPGNRFIGHDGEVGDWPVNRATGREISLYRNNDFGGYKSYHVFGTYTDFFGAYWHDLGFGMVRYAPHDEKPGKKLWIWGLSRQGMIWENLLTDSDGQYTEVQSGLLFNQTAEASSRTPLKHRGFAPHGSERWTEYWYPVRAIGGIVAASPLGALNVRSGAGGTVVSFSAAQSVNDTLVVRDGDRLVGARHLTLRPLETLSDTLPPGVDPDRLRVTIGAGRLEYDADTARTSLSAAAFAASHRKPGAFIKPWPTTNPAAIFETSPSAEPSPLIFPRDFSASCQRSSAWRSPGSRR